MRELIDILTGTPWWVYLLLIYLLRIGIRAAKTRIVGLRKLFVLPAILLLMSLHNLNASVTANPYVLLVFSGAILIGSMLGFMQIFRLPIKVDRQQYLLQIPGTWSTLILVLLIFASKYYFGFELSLHPTLKYQTSFLYQMLAVNGICTGLFVGRLLGYLFHFYKSG